MKEGLVIQPPAHLVAPVFVLLMFVVLVALIPVVVAVVMMIPAVIVLDAPAVSSPVALVELAAFIAGTDPIRAWVRSPSPITLVPLVMVSHRIPVSIDPYIARTGTSGNDANDRRRGRPNSYSDRNLCRRYGGAS